MKKILILCGMYLLICGQIFCKIPLKVLKERIHLVFTFEHLHFMPFKSKQHLESRSSYIVVFFLNQQMTPAGTCLMWLDLSLQGDIPGTSLCPFTSSSGAAGPADLCWVPWVWPLLGPLSLLAVLAHSSCFPFISWLHSLQRAWEYFPSEAAISVLHSGQFSCHTEPSFCSTAHLHCCWMCPRQSELRARDGAERNSCHGLLGDHPPAHLV